MWIGIARLAANMVKLNDLELRNVMLQLAVSLNMAGSSKWASHDGPNTH